MLQLFIDFDQLDIPLYINNKSTVHLIAEKTNIRYRELNVLT